MKKVSKSELKARMLEYFREVESTGEELVVLDRGTPVLKVVPIRKARTAAEVFGDLRGKARSLRAALEPTTDEWSET
jgi:prevent-host-death family protein